MKHHDNYRPTICSFIKRANKPKSIACWSARLVFTVFFSNKNSLKNSRELDSEYLSISEHTCGCFFIQGFSCFQKQLEEEMKGGKQSKAFVVRDELSIRYCRNEDGESKM